MSRFEQRAGNASGSDKPESSTDTRPEPSAEPQESAARHSSRLATATDAAASMQSQQQQ